MTDTLKRRCLHLYIDYPDSDQEQRIVSMKVPDISGHLVAQVVAFVQRLRGLDIKKVPSISETLDWARALVLLNAGQLEPAVVRDTLNLVLKYEGDIEKTQGELDRIVLQVTSG
jgi:MoxR-like ATPase